MECGTTNGSSAVNPQLDHQEAFTLLEEGTRLLEEQGIENPREEASLLLLSFLSLRQIDLYIEPMQLVPPDAQTCFLEGIARRCRHEPLQYITGEVDFCGLSFLVRPGVFIPRPETELIIEALVGSPTRILDLCTGSGALAITLAIRFPEANVTAVDTSAIARETARENQKRHLVPQVHFLQGDLFSPLNPLDRFDLIVCNPPYIAEENSWQVDAEVLEYEPVEALFSPDGGMAHIKRVLTEAPNFLAEGGQLLLEIGIGQSPALVLFIKEKTPFTVQVIQDWAGIDRILVCQWTQS